MFTRYLLDTRRVLPGQRVEIAPEQPGANNLQFVLVEVRRGTPIMIKVTAPVVPRLGPEAVALAFSSVMPQSDEPGFYSVPQLAVLGPKLFHSEAAWTRSGFVDVGNPHCTTFVRHQHHLPTQDQLAGVDQELRALAFHPDGGGSQVFAEGCNLHWAWVVTSTLIHLVIFERGEGPTPASGSSALAAACLAFSSGLVSHQLTVSMPGGDLDILLEGTRGDLRQVSLLGSAEKLLAASVAVSLEQQE
jgi:diaminopimelate epimerase